MSLSCQIRSAVAGDSDVISKLAFHAKATWGYSSEQMQLFVSELSFSGASLVDPLCPTFVLERNDRVAGFCRVDLGLVDCSELDALYVDPAHMGKGVGATLLDHARTIALAAGFNKMLIQSDPNAASFYMAHGAVEVGVRESGSVAGRYLPLLRLTLGAARRQGHAVETR